MAETELRTLDSKAGPDAKRAIYDTAVQLFARNGYAGTGVREIAKEAGVNLAAVNYFYGSKMGLLRAILEDYFSGLRAVFESNISGDDPPEIKLRRAIAAAARYMGEAPDRMLIALTELPHDAPEITELKAGWITNMTQMFEQHVLAQLPEEERERLPHAVIAPAVATLTASHFLFRPVLERARPPGYVSGLPEGYPELIATLFLDGFNGLRRGGGGS